MRLLILTPEFGEARGGLAAFYRHLVPPLAGLGVEVRVIEGSAAHAGDAAPRSVDGAQVETLELDRLTRWNDRFAALAAAPGLRRHLAAAWAMWEQAGEGAWADVIEAADWGLAYVPPAVAATRPLVVQGHGSIGQISVHDPLSGEEVQSALCRLIEVAVLARAPVLQTYSHLNADFWAAETGRTVTMIRPAVPMPPLTATAEISDRGLVAGRIQRWKGPDVLCQALALMGAGAPAVDWLGRDTPYGRRDGSTAAAMARAYPDIWGRRVLPAPSVAPAEVTARQAVARFNLVPSAWDVFNFTAVEAMASGRPAVVSTGAGASELVVEGETGFVFENGNAASLASALERVMGAAETELAAIGAAARETVRRELDPMRIAEARLAAYQAAVDDFARNPPAPIGGWLGDICRPDATAADAATFLDQFPIRTIASHLASRLVAKAEGAPAMTSRAATILITGGAGYIGSQFALSCIEAGHRVVVVDDLSSGRRASAPPECVFYKIDVTEKDALRSVFAENEIEICVHFAAKISVPDSFSDPIGYYRTNVGGLLAVATACAIHGVNKFIFSSTAAVYGLVATGIASESTPLAPISPYARSKLMAETILADLARASDLRFVALRYFNVAGADPLGRLGQGENANKHLIKAACEAALGSRDFLEIYGADYDTPDGTCVRDFIHVADLADAHLRAVDYLIEGGPTTVLNCGYGRGHSVLEVVAAVERASGQPMRLRTSGRREGDPPMLIADASRIHATLGWMPKYADLDVVVGSAFNWERRCIEQRELAISDRTN